MACEIEFLDDIKGYSVIFDDNDRVAYAYLLNSCGKIVGDVWLYNVCNTPNVPEWSDPEKVPFANPKDYVKKDCGFERVKDSGDVIVQWEVGNLDSIEARLFLHGKFFAKLVEGKKPGFSLLASKNGPLAKVLNLDESI